MATHSTEEKAKLLDVLNAVTGRNFRVLPLVGTSYLLDKFSMEEIERALKKLMRSEWHLTHIKELSSEYLLRATTIDKWLQLADCATPVNTLNDEPLVTI